MNDSLLEFLRTGAFATVRLGMSAEELLEILGKPDNVGCQRATDSADDSVWLFGSQGSNNLQIRLLDKRVIGIWLYLWSIDDVRSLPSVLSATNWQISGRTSIEEFTRLLEAEDIRWRTYGPLTFDMQTCILMESNVHAIWAHGEHEGLEKIMLTKDPNEC